MEVQLSKKYPLAVSASRAWAVLADIRAVGACMPGAQITDQVDATHYKGLVKSKVGPAVMSFTGDIEVLGLDAPARQVELLGKGADKGGSSAAMRLLARIEAGDDAAACVLFGDATVTVSGKLAQFGGRLLVPIADAMLAQFAKNFEAAAAAIDLPATEDPRAGEPVMAAGAFEAPTNPSASASNELNAFGLAWLVLRGWFLGLLGKKPA
ncbi:MAG TPA: SRPBCC family protein [Burkholderiaceae bacterium]|jgi:hypothetical protein|nr:SRPBCC family protein [Burkholderiaceae bacterium]